MKNIVKLLLLCTIISIGCALGLNINSVNAQIYVSDYSTTQTTPPNKYDLREQIHIEVENQHDFGICYAFAPLTSLETYLALHYNEYYDFSEMHLATSLCLQDNYHSSIGSSLEDGGNFSHFVLYTQKDKSLVLDQLMPIDKYRSLPNYQRDQLIKNDYTSTNNNFNPIVKVNDTKSFDVIWGNKSKYSPAQLSNFRTQVKNHIMQYGSLSASIHSNNSFSKSTKYYRIVNDALATSQDAVRSNINHMISVVGWDDNYDANGHWVNKGAYLCLNSWGKDFGDSGYFYVSYDDYFIESSMHGVIDATLCVGKDKISTISSYQNKTSIYTHVFYPTPTTYTANIINVSKYLNQTITNIDSFIIGSNYNIYYRFFNSYSDALNGINSNTYKLDTTSYATYSLYTKLNLKFGLKISNNYLLLITEVENTAEINSLGGDKEDSLNLPTTYIQQNGLKLFSTSLHKWTPNVTSRNLDLTIPVNLYLDTTNIEVLPIESTSQSIINDRYKQNNRTHLGKLFTIKLNNVSLTPDIIKSIKIIRLNGNIDVTSNFEISLNSNNIDICLIKTRNLVFNESINNYLISIPYLDTNINRIIEIEDVGELYNITYQLNGGQATNTLTYTSKQSSLILNNPIKAGYDFVGWYTDSDLSVEFDKNNLPYKDLTLYAKYQIKPPTIISKSNDINTIYNGKDVILDISATHDLLKDGYTLKYQWYYTNALSLPFTPITDATSRSLTIHNIDDSGYYACEVSLLDQSNNILSSISHNDNQVHITANISKANLTININNISSSHELSDDELSNKLSCKIDCQYLPKDVITYQEILDYLQLKFKLVDTSSRYVKDIYVTIKDFDIYNVYINPGQYRIVVNQLDNNNIHSTSEQGFVKDCVFNVADYGLTPSAKQLLKSNNLNLVDCYDISYSHLDTPATIYIPISNKMLLTNLSLYMLKDNQLIKLDSVKTVDGLIFTTIEADAKYIIVQEKPDKLSNIDFLILTIVIIIFGALAIYIIVTKHNHKK